MTFYAPISIGEIRSAAEAIRGKVRRTPQILAAPVLNDDIGASYLQLKLECLQVTGSFKARGAMNALSRLSPDALSRGIITASGGNHGLAVAYAGWAAKVPATIYLPRSVGADKIAKLVKWGAKPVIEGETWDDSNDAAVAHAAREGLAYLHPFADPTVIAGQGTVALEMLADAPNLETLIVAIGGGGLVSGVALAAKALKPSIRIVGVEPMGAPTLHSSLAAGEPVTLAQIRTKAGTLAPKSTDPLNFSIVRDLVSEVVLVSDEEMRAATRWLWFEMGIAAELSGAAALAVLQTGRYRPSAGEPVCAIICGAGTDGITE